jgi:hypothetical protein
MVVARKIISSALVELGNEEPTTRDKWLTVDAWKKLLFTRYDFDSSSIDFTIRQFSHALNLLGSIRLKVSTGNLTGTHVREKFCPVVNEDGKNTGKTQKKLFLLLASSKDIEPKEPTTNQEWNAALTASQAIADGNVSVKFSHSWPAKREKRKGKEVGMKRRDD